MDTAEARLWLDREWVDALKANVMSPDEEIDALANSNTIAIRYALVTQLLGKIADPSRSLFAVQQSAPMEGAWDARSFSTAVVVPWVADNQHVLGTSAEPYASKPLRRPRLEYEMLDVKDKKGWRRLVTLFGKLEQAEHTNVVATFRLVLASLVRRLSTQTFGYTVPQRVSLPRVQLILDRFLATPSGGLRPLAVTAALLRTVGRAFTIFSRVESQGLNEADAVGGMPGDILCFAYNETERICLVVEVKDLDLTIAHVRASSSKAKQADEGLTSLLFAVPGVAEADQEEIRNLVRREWASGLNIYTSSIRSLIDALFVLLDEVWRVRLLRAIGDELDERQNQAARKAWHDVLLETEGSDA